MNEVNMNAIGQEIVKGVDNKEVADLKELMNSRVYSWRGLR